MVVAVPMMDMLVSMMVAMPALDMLVPMVVAVSTLDMLAPMVVAVPMTDMLVPMVGMLVAMPMMDMLVPMVVVVPTMVADPALTPNTAPSPPHPTPTFVEVAVDADAVGHGHVQHLGLVGVLGAEADLQPVVEVKAPGGRSLAQLVEFAQAAICHPHAESFAVPVVPHLPVVVIPIDQRVTCGHGARLCLGHAWGAPSCPHPRQVLLGAPRPPPSPPVPSGPPHPLCAPILSHTPGCLQCPHRPPAGVPSSHPEPCRTRR